MNKIISSGLILLADTIITGCEVVDATKNPKKFLWRAAGMGAVTYGIYKWHMGIIHSAHKAKAEELIENNENTETDATSETSEK